MWKIGAIAQLGERFNGIEEVVGSIPSGSTISPRLIRAEGQGRGKKPPANRLRAVFCCLVARASNGWPAEPFSRPGGIRPDQPDSLSLKIPDPLILRSIAPWRCVSKDGDSSSHHDFRLLDPSSFETPCAGARLLRMRGNERSTGQALDAAQRASGGQKLTSSSLRHLRLARDAAPLRNRANTTACPSGCRLNSSFAYLRA